MAKGYIFDKLLNRKIEGETNLTSLDEINEVINKNAEVAEDLEMLVSQVDRNTANLGTKLYNHRLSIDDGGGTQEVLVTTTFNTPITTNNMDLLGSALNITDGHGRVYMYQTDDRLMMSLTSTGIVSNFEIVSITNDTVTPL